MPQTIKRPRGRPRDEGLTSRRREQILDAAARVFAELGYADTDVQVVADSLALGKGTIYRYFPTKKELFLAAVDRGVRQLIAQVQAAVNKLDDPLDRITTGIREYLAFFKAHPELVELFIQERAAFRNHGKTIYFQHREANIWRWQSLFRSLIAAGRVRSVPVQRITDVIGDILYGSMFTNHLAGRRKSPERHVRDVVDVVFHGILTDSRRYRIGTAAQPERKT